MVHQDINLKVEKNTQLVIEAIYKQLIIMKQHTTTFANKYESSKLRHYR